MDHLNIILIVAGIVTTVYIVLVASMPRDLFKSEELKAAEAKADMIYYLPTASIQLTVTATVETISVNNGGVSAVRSAQLSSLTYQANTSIVPDPTFLIKLDYKPTIFMSDEVKITAGTNGLLDNISATADDRSSAIIQLIADAPTKVLSLKAPVPVAQPAPLPPGQTLEVIQKTFTNSFTVRPEEFSARTAQFPWIFLTDGNISIDASFKVDFKGPNRIAINAGNVNSFDGLLSRPLAPFGLSLTVTGNTTLKNKTIQTSLSLPDDTRLIQIPVKRSPFVKRINQPKFFNGMLIENVIIKPSEFEGVISIPVNVLKAVLSIPSQLFNFRIHHKYDGRIDELALQKKLDDLEKELKPSKDNPGLGKKFFP